VYELAIETTFAAAHRLRGYEGDCERLHGHNYRVRAVWTSDELDDLGLVVDFREAKKALRAVTGELDHRLINEHEAFKDRNPSTENIARFIYEGLEAGVGGRARLSHVTVWETDGASITYRP
jgi:6-pyruvoyltetrahydropterin/6-carboxytetrahydropterin synthase